MVQNPAPSATMTADGTFCLEDEGLLLEVGSALDSNLRAAGASAICGLALRGRTTHLS